MHTCTNVIYALHDIENTIRSVNSEVYNIDRIEIVSEETEIAFQIFKSSLFKDLEKLKK